MAEGWTRHLKGDLLEPWSAGVEPKGVDPCAMEVMSEAGVDISGQQARHVDTIKHMHFDWVITVCDNARESCPLFPGKTRVIHVGFDDPPWLAREAKDREDRLRPYRRVRDEIRGFVEGLPGSLREP